MGLASERVEVLSEALELGDKAYATDGQILKAFGEVRPCSHLREAVGCAARGRARGAVLVDGDGTGYRFAGCAYRLWPFTSGAQHED